MLVLSRKKGESIQVGANVTVTIVGVHGKTVRLAIEAPRDVIVDRSEVFERKRAEIEALGFGKAGNDGAEAMPRAKRPERRPAKSAEPGPGGGGNSGAS